MYNFYFCKNGVKVILFQLYIINIERLNEC
nr:MAG TPA: hypothetical protein [Caudoviricetes sp.]